MEHSLILQLRTLDLQLQSATDAALRECGLTLPQWSALDALDRHPAASNADLARICGVSPQTMHGILAALTTAGLIVRQPHRIHGRVLETYIANGGTARLKEGRVAIATLEERMLATIPMEDRATLSRTLSMISGMLAR